MTISLSINQIYEFSLQQLAAESYLEDANKLSDLQYLKDNLALGTNRKGYKPPGSDNELNGGWPE